MSEINDITKLNIHQIHKIIEELRKDANAQAVIVFGSLAYDDINPGSDLDLILISESVEQHIYQPTIHDGIFIDLNIVSPIGLQDLIEKDWYWRGILWLSKLLNPHEETKKILEQNYKSQDLVDIRKMMIEKWIQLSLSFKEQSDNTNLVWLAHAARWHMVVSLVNGYLQLCHGRPHAYHRHLQEVKNNFPECQERDSYLEYICEGRGNFTSVENWLKSQTKSGTLADRIDIKTQMFRDRIHWLLSLKDKENDAIVYAKHSLWVLLMFCAANVLGAPLAKSRTNYVDMIEKIAPDVPDEIALLFESRIFSFDDIDGLALKLTNHLRQIL